MLNWRKVYFIFLFAVGMQFLNLNSFSFGSENNWAKPGETVQPGMLHLKLKAECFPIEVKIHKGVPYCGIKSIDAVSEDFVITDFAQSSRIMEKCRDNPWTSHIERWFTVSFPKETGLFEIRKAYQTCPEVEYAEFAVIFKSLLTPDDPMFEDQWFLRHCGFEEAWDVSQGSEEICVGVIDGGVDMDVNDDNSNIIHEDLAANLWFNIGEDADGNGVYSGLDDWNGRDDDNNGYVDDFLGWNFTEDNNWPDDPYGEDGGHGSHIASDVSAVTDNETGVAGAGFNTRLMITCDASPDQEGMHLYYNECILYCAQMGADIINLSFGVFSAFQRFTYERIQFAIEEGSIVFAAAGNDNEEDYEGRDNHLYPCAYDGVIGVGGTNQADYKSNQSNWGDYTDLVAPAYNILGCWTRNAYSSRSGTSAASPIAAGLAALYLSVRPDLTTDELLRQMQMTATDISALNPNHPGIQYRINAENLLKSIYPKFNVVEMNRAEIQGNGDDYIDPEETFDLPFTIENLEAYESATGVNCTLMTDNPTIRIIRNAVRVGDLEPGEQFESQVGFRIFHGWSHPHYATFQVKVSCSETEDQIIDVPMTIGHPYYYLIDDDNSDADEDGEKDATDVNEFFEADFAEHSYVYEKYDVFEEFLPPEQELLNSFPVVFWFTGGDANALSNDDIAALQAYLDSGSAGAKVRLILAGQYIGDKNGDSEFFRNYLHVNHLMNDDGTPMIEGTAGGPFDEFSMLLVGAGGAGNNRSESTMEPIDGAETIFYYGRHDDEPAAGVLYRSEGYDVIYLGFALEAASGGGGTTPRHEIVQALLDNLFAVDITGSDNSNVPSKFDLSSPYPNPFNAATEVKIELPRTTELTLKVVDIYGRQAATLFDGVSPAGTRTFTWNAQDAAAGMYFIQMNWDNRSLTRKTILVK